MVMTRVAVSAMAARATAPAKTRTSQIGSTAAGEAVTVTPKTACPGAGRVAAATAAVKAQAGIRETRAVAEATATAMSQRTACREGRARATATAAAEMGEAAAMTGTPNRRLLRLGTVRALPRGRPRARWTRRHRGRRGSCRCQGDHGHMRRQSKSWLRRRRRRRRHGRAAASPKFRGRRPIADPRGRAGGCRARGRHEEERARHRGQVRQR